MERSIRELRFELASQTTSPYVAKRKASFVFTFVFFTLVFPDVNKVVVSQIFMVWHGCGTFTGYWVHSCIVFHLVVFFINRLGHTCRKRKPASVRSPWCPACWRKGEYIYSKTDGDNETLILQDVVKISGRQKTKRNNQTRARDYMSIWDLK